MEKFGVWWGEQLWGWCFKCEYKLPTTVECHGSQLETKSENEREREREAFVSLLKNKKVLFLEYD